MTQSFTSRSVEQLLAEVAARTAAPGGGAVAALTLAMAASLAAMAARFADPNSDAVLAADALCDEAAALADRDAQAYAAYLAARRSGTSGSRDALSDATDVPLAMVRVGERIAGLAAEVAANGKPALRGDVTVAAVLAAAAARAAATLVEINAGPADRKSQSARQGAETADRAAAALRALGTGPGGGAPNATSDVPEL